MSPSEIILIFFDYMEEAVKRNQNTVQVQSAKYSPQSSVLIAQSTLYIEHNIMYVQYV
jgi:hypothetical protein